VTYQPADDGRVPTKPTLNNPVDPLMIFQDTPDIQSIRDTGQLGNTLVTLEHSTS
jgi:hypothetical protein